MLGDRFNFFKNQENSEIENPDFACTHLFRIGPPPEPINGRLNTNVKHSGNAYYYGAHVKQVDDTNLYDVYLSLREGGTSYVGQGDMEEAFWADSKTVHLPFKKHESLENSLQSLHDLENAFSFGVPKNDSRNFPEVFEGVANTKEIPQVAYNQYDAHYVKYLDNASLELSEDGLVSGAEAAVYDG